MKWIGALLVLCVACVSTNGIDEDFEVLRRVAGEAVNEFAEGMEKHVELLSEALGRSSLADELKRIEEDLKLRLAWAVRSVVDGAIHDARTAADRNFRLNSEIQEEVDRLVRDVEENREEPARSEVVRRFENRLMDSIREVRHSLFEALERLSDAVAPQVISAARTKILEDLNFGAISEYLRTELGESHEFATAILTAVSERGDRRLVKDVVEHLLPSPTWNSTAIAKRWAFSLRSVGCFIVGLVTKGYGVEYIVDWIKRKVPENWKGKFLDLVAHGGKFVLKWGAKTLCLSLGPARKSSVAVFDLVREVRRVLGNLGLVAQNDFFRFAEWLRSLWIECLENAFHGFDALYQTALQLGSKLYAANNQRMMLTTARLSDIYAKNALGEDPTEAIRKVLRGD